MKKGILLPLSIILSVLLLDCKNNNKIYLFNNEDLSDWYLHTEQDSIDVEEIFYIKEGVLHVSGTPAGYIRTSESFRNYRLHLEWRWAEEPGNSGVLLHTTGEDMIWPNCIEAQLQSGNAGDIVLIGTGAGLQIGDSMYIIEPGEFRYEVYRKKIDSNEKQPGEWNSYDILARDDIIELKVNGSLQNSGTGATLRSGYICLQSEGAPIEFRNVYLVKK